MELISNEKSNDFLIEDQIAFKNLLDEADGLIYQFQYSPKENCFSVPFASKGLWNIYELKPKEVKNDATPIFNRIHEDDIASVRNMIAESIQLMENRTYEYRVVLPSKGVRWIRGHARPIKMKDGSFLWNGCAMDITEQKQLELALFESKQRLELAIEGSGDNIWDWNVKKNEIIYSDESKKMFGYEPHELGPGIETWSNLVHADDKELYYNNMKKHSKSDTNYYNSEYRVLCKDGSYKWILDRGKVIERDKSGNIIRIVGTHSDITLQKQKQEEAQNTIDIIGEQNNRLLNFAHIVSHNLRSHASSFKMLMDIVNTTNDQKERKEAFYHLNNVSNALTDTITHLTEIVSVQTNINEESKKINLHDYIQKTIDILKGDIDQKKAIVINQVPAEIFINYNPAYLESIILNLMSNALKYKHPDRNPEVKLEAFYENKRLVLQISDNGRGIDLNKYGESLFGMYKTFHGNKDAVGIGLFITKNQINSMGSEISVQSELNMGTSFKITF